MLILVLSKKSLKEGVTRLDASEDINLDAKQIPAYTPILTSRNISGPLTISLFCSCPYSPSSYSSLAFTACPFIMFSLVYYFLFIFGLIVPTGSLLANALPGLSTPAPFVSLTLSRPTHGHNVNIQHIHGTILQQQHINRGLRRLALMTGSPPPSDHELLELLHTRIRALHASKRSEYELDHNRSLVTSTKKRQAGSALPPPLHSTGLSIESNDIGYIANLDIGTPFKTFRLLIDSGSADLWVGSTECRSDSGGGCGNHNYLGSNSSSTYVQSKDDWAIGYVSGTVSGFLAGDTVSVAGLTLRNHTFGVAFNESADFTGENTLFDGLLGLATSTVSQQHVPTLLQSLVQSRLINATIVSYKIPRLSDGANNTGELTLGAMDPSHYSSASLVSVKNVNKFGYWGVAVDAVTAGGQDMKWSNRTILMDTGTAMIIAPKNDVQAIHDAIPGSVFDGQGYTVPCNVSTVISLTIGGKSFPIDPRDLAIFPVDQNSTMCMSGIGIGGVGPFDLDTDWLVGDVFLKNIYFSTDEDNNKISIAKPLF